ncbi:MULTISPECIES: hypothetical protein [Clostridium]|uniref:Uncharacterized protein n=1 Tax=Clostridium coskatii TaxID=1705578 RepID=A0A166TUA3_9CLOT|nr:MULTISPECIES: hypothetical protein [Clostridium]OAA94101.1 hypothetical protein WX73_03671 [Clostridium coskatii]OBR96663.1 hypothetical protein CLCOS_08250 [Clostridium coskatii]QXE20435.1 hypothetical protein B5S50_17195 [Clostridium sp. 001]
MKKKELNERQLNTLRKLIYNHIHEFLTDKVKANKTFEKIKKYGIKTMPEAVALYKENRS